MAIHKLTQRKVETAGLGKYEDGGGLRLVVSNAGARKWILRFTLHPGRGDDTGKRREMGLGSFPDVGMTEARERAAAYRRQVRSGIDPIAARRSARSGWISSSEQAARAHTRMPAAAGRRNARTSNP